MNQNQKKAKEIASYFRGKPVEVTIVTLGAGGPPLVYPSAELRAYEWGEQGCLLTATPTRKIEGISANLRDFQIERASFDEEEARWMFVDGPKIVYLEEALPLSSEFSSAIRAFQSSDIVAAVRRAMIRYIAGFEDAQELT